MPLSRSVDPNERMGALEQMLATLLVRAAAAAAAAASGAASGGTAAAGAAAADGAPQTETQRTNARVDGVASVVDSRAPDAESQFLLAEVRSLLSALKEQQQEAQHASDLAALHQLHLSASSHAGSHAGSQASGTSSPVFGGSSASSGSDSDGEGGPQTLHAAAAPDGWQEQLNELRSQLIAVQLSQQDAQDAQAEAAEKAAEKEAQPSDASRLAALESLVGQQVKTTKLYMDPRPAAGVGVDPINNLCG